MTRRAIAVLAAISLSAGAIVGAEAMAQAAEDSPAVNDCLRVDGGLRDSTAPFDIVDCAEEHNSDVVRVLAYPEDAGPPSTIADTVVDYVGAQCSWDDVHEWLGASTVTLPLRVGWWFRLPTDEQWERGARWIACSTNVPDRDGSAMVYTGTLPSLFAQTPLIDWVVCAKGKPRSGEWTDGVACTSASRWLFISGFMIKGKVTKRYPKDLQARADAKCAKKAKRYLVKGATSSARAALDPAGDVGSGEVFGDCFIALRDWDGKG